MALVSLVMVGPVAALGALASRAIGAPTTATILVYFGIGLLGMVGLTAASLLRSRDI